MSLIGRYWLFIQSLFVNRQSPRTYIDRTLDECMKIGISSIFIVTLVSIFMGGVTSLQTIYNFRKNVLHLEALISTAIRSMITTEISPTITALIFSGRIGASIASEISSMKITEQVDALEVMGINSKSYLTLPKIIASMIMFPLLVIVSACTALGASFIIAYFLDLAPEDFTVGIRTNFEMYIIWVSIIKTVIFAFLISSISSYYGFHVKGGALDIGVTATKAVTSSCIAVLVSNYIVSQLLL